MSYRKVWVNKVFPLVLFNGSKVGSLGKQGPRLIKFCWYYHCFQEKNKRRNPNRALFLVCSNILLCFIGIQGRDIRILESIRSWTTANQNYVNMYACVYVCPHGTYYRIVQSTLWRPAYWKKKKESLLPNHYFNPIWIWHLEALFEIQEEVLKWIPWGLLQFSGQLYTRGAHDRVDE